MKQAKTDYTYCYGMNCENPNKCWRYTGNYEFDRNNLYSFVAGNIGEQKCIEKK